MEQIISKEEPNKIMKVKGEIRGVAIKGEMEFILKEEGKEGLKKLEDQMAELGYPIKYKEIKPMTFYPLNLYGAIQLVVKSLFNFDNKKFQEMGAFEAKISLIARLFMKFFFSSEKMIREAPKMWKRYLTIGDLKVIETNEEKKYLILRIENFRFHLIHCQILKGFISTIIQMIVNSKVSCEETKCVYEGDEYHEFLLKW